MDHFESIVATLLESEGYWVRRGFKVNVSKEEKRAIGKHSIPRPEIDLVAFNHADNSVIAFEAKSYLDSPGVRLAELQVEHDVPEGRYKLFTSTRYRNIVIARLLADLHACGMADRATTVTLGLAAAKVYAKDAEGIQILMDKRGWVFWSPAAIKAKVTALAERSYENDPAIITAKILMR